MKKFITVITACIGFNVSFSLAEDVNQKITINDAIKIIKENNYDVKIASYEVKKVEGQYIQTKFYQNPTLSVNYTGLVFGKNIVYDTGNTMLSIRVDQPFELGGKRENRIKSAFYQLQSVNYQKEDTTRSVILNFLSVYFQTLSDKSYYEYLKQDLDDYEKMLQIQEKKQKAGFLSLIDYMKLQLYKNELENSKLQAESTYKKDLQEIKFYLNGNYEPVSVNIDTKEPNLDDLVQKATEKRESIKAFQEQLNSVEHQIKLIKVYSIPDVSLGVEYDSFGTQYKPGVGFGFSLNLPTFDKRKGDLITAIALKEQTLVALSKEKDRIRKEISQAYEDYQVSKKIYNSYLEKKKVMDDLLERTKKAYSIGGISTLDFLDTLRTYKSFMNAYLQSYYQFLNNYSSLKILSGEDLW